MTRNGIKRLQKCKKMGKNKKMAKITMKHLKYAPMGSPWSMPPRGPSQMLVMQPKMGQKEPKKGQNFKKNSKKK